MKRTTDMGFIKDALKYFFGSHRSFYWPLENFNKRLHHHLCTWKMYAPLAREKKGWSERDCGPCARGRFKEKKDRWDDMNFWTTPAWSEKLKQTRCFWHYFVDESDKCIIGIALWMKSPNILQNLSFKTVSTQAEFEQFNIVLDTSHEPMAQDCKQIVLWGILWSSCWGKV